MTQNPRSQPETEQRCPCGSGDTYAGCCARFHRGAPAPTAEALMRSRYSANALLHHDPELFAGYLHRTWAVETRPALSDLTAPGPQWKRLNILSTTAGGPFHDTGTVEFVAAYLDHGPPAARGRLHELSRFRRESGEWLYIDGDLS